MAYFVIKQRDAGIKGRENVMEETYRVSKHLRSQGNVPCRTEGGRGREREAGR